MNYYAHVNQISRNEWESATQQFDDYSIYQTWPYQENRAKIDGQELKQVIVRNDNDDICLMAQVRVKKAPLLPFRVGYVQNGPLIKKNGSLPADGEKLIEIMIQALFDDGINALRIVPCVVVDDSGFELEKKLLKIGFEKKDSKKCYHTFRVDVSDSEEGIRQRLRKSFRRDLKKAESAGLTIQSGTEDKLFDILADLYEESKGRKGFDGLEIEEFSIPQKELLDSEKTKAFVAFFDDKPASALLSTELGDSSIVLLAASNEIGLEKGSSYLLWYQACVSAHKKGLRWCDLGGIDPEANPNVYQFKSRLGGAEMSYIGCFDICKGVASQALMTLIEKMKG